MHEVERRHHRREIKRLNNVIRDNRREQRRDERINRRIRRERNLRDLDNDLPRGFFS